MGNVSSVSEAVPRVAVRWPFRFLAALIFLAGVVALFASALQIYSLGAPFLQPHAIVALPGIAWLLRITWHAARDARSPAQEWWPFASSRVFFWYAALTLLSVSRT
jgi:hypothetical protein